MANLGNLWFSVGLKDQTDADWAEIVNKIKSRTVELGLKIDKDSIEEALRGIQSSGRMPNMKVGIEIDEEKLRRAYHALDGLDLKQLREARLQMKDSVNAGSAEELRRSRAALADYREERTKEVAASIRSRDALTKLRMSHVASQKELARSRRALADLREARLRDAEAARQQRAANNGLNHETVKTNSIMSQLRNEILNVYSVYTIQNFLRSVIEIGGEFEKQRLALGSILQDAGHATELFSQIKNLAVISPFGIRELTNYAKQLAAFNIPYSELYDTTKRLADISAGVGVDMSRIILAYGQVRSAEFLKGTELRQFTEAGIPLVQALADYFTKLEGTAVSIGDVFDKISKRQVSFDDVRKVLWAMTDEGGLFNNMQEVLSESLSGKWSNLKDAYDIMLADIAESNNAIAKGVIEGLTELMSNWEALVPVVFSAIGALGYYKAAIASNNILHGKENLELTRNALLLKQKQADVLRIAQTYRALTASEQGLLASSGKLSTAEYRQLAVSGQLTKEYALRLMALGRLKAGQAGHIAQVLQISKAEMAAALSASKWRVAMAGLAVSVRGLGLALKSLLFNPFTMVFAVLSLATEALMHFSQKNDEMEQNVRDLAQKATEGYKRVHEQLKGFEGIDLGKVRGDSLVTSIEQIEETLKNYSPRYNDIQKEADGVSELTDRYRILLDALRETEEAYKTLEEIKDVSEAANAATDGWLDESLRENAQDYSEALQAARKELRDLSQYSISISEAIQEAAKTDGGFAKAIEGKTLNEQIALLYNYGKAYQYVLTSFSGKAERVALMDYFDAIREAASVFEKEVVPDAERYADYMRNALEGEGWDFSKLTKAQEDALRMAVQDFVTKIPDITEDARKKIEDEILTVRFQLAPVIEDYQAAPILGTYAKLIDGVSDNGLFTQKELSSVNDAASAYKLVSGRLKEAEENLASLNRVKADAMTPEQRSIYTSQLEAAEKEADGYRKVREALFNEEQKEQKATGSGKDAVAERWKERLGLMKEAESEYRKWSELVGKDAAVEKLRESGLFGELGADFDFADARKEIAKFVDEIGKVASTDAQKDVVREGMEVVLGFRYDKNKEGLDKALAEVQAYIDKQAGKWNLYKGLLGHTGDKELSFGIAFGGAFDEDLADFETMMRRTFDEAMADKGLAYTYEELWLKGTEGIPKDVARLYENVKKEIDGYYEDEKKRLGEILGEYQSNREKIVKTEQEAAEKIALIRKQMASGAIGGAEGGAAINRIQGEADWEKFTLSADYLKFFSSISALTRHEAQEIGNVIRKNLDQRLQEGVLSAEDYYKEIERINQQLEKMNGLHTNFGSFMTGGLEGLFENMFRKGQEMMTAGSIDLQHLESPAKEISDKLEDLAGDIGLSSDVIYTASSDMVLAGTDVVKGAEIFSDAVDRMNDEKERYNATEKYDTDKDGEKNVAANSANQIGKLFNVAGLFKSSMSSAAQSAQSAAASNAVSASNMMQAGQGMMGAAQGAMSSVAIVDAIVHGINNMVQGLAGAFDKIKESMDALGKDTSLDSGIGKLSAGMSIFAEASQNATDAWDSLKSGDMGGVINGVVGSFTSWITGFARLHDAKLEEKIEESKQRVKELQNVYDEMDRLLERTLGDGHTAFDDLVARSTDRLNELKKTYDDMVSESGFRGALAFGSLYGDEYEELKKQMEDYGDIIQEGSGLYGLERKNLKKQLSEVEEQLQNELAKKDVDESVVADYEAQISEMKDQIRYFAQDLAEELYGIDLKDWASQLGDALYEAWQNGEDGAEAFREKAAEIIGDVMNQILKLRILEPAMQDISDYLFGEDGESGAFGKDLQLDEGEIGVLAEKLLGMADVSEEYTEMMDQLNEYLKEAGVDLKDLGDSASDGLTAGIQGVTEDTAGLLASYINAIRADVSVERGLVERFVGDDFPQVSAMVQAQLAQLEMIARNTGANAESAAGILELLRRNVNGGNKFHFG